MGGGVVAACEGGGSPTRAERTEGATSVVIEPKAMQVICCQLTRGHALRGWFLVGPGDKYLPSPYKRNVDSQLLAHLTGPAWCAKGPIIGASGARPIEDGRQLRRRTWGHREARVGAGPEIGIC